MSPTLLTPADHLPQAHPADSPNAADDPAPGEAAESPSPVRGGRREGRVSAEMLAQRAQFLPPAPRAIANAYFALGMSVHELAALHHLTPRQMRRRIETLRETLEDPAFILAAQFADQLPRDLALLARAYWVEGLPLRALARSRRRSVHYIRRRIADARSLLLLQLRNHREISPGIAERTLTRRNRPRK
jgi:hypothetical protein